MEGVGILAMNGSELGDRSYANNSSLQQKMISMTLPIVKEAITDLYYKTCPDVLKIADLGCSSGPNTFMVVSNLIKQVEDIREELGKKKKNIPIEYQIFLNDLPHNDFNAIFKALPNFLNNLKTQIKTNLGPCFFTGVPGSFYGRLFPSKSIHFVHSSSSLHWLSQVPEGLESNKGKIFMSYTSPKSVLDAYYKQFQKDFSKFLKCRAEELITGGHMVLTRLGRTSEDRSSKECCQMWELLGLALNDMVGEGIVEEEKVDSFNIPKYMPSATELEMEVLNEGSFKINGLEVSRTDWGFFNKEFNSSTTVVENAGSVAQGMRAATEPLIARHFGESIMDELFNRYKQILIDTMSKENYEFINLTISLTKIK